MKKFFQISLTVSLFMIGTFHMQAQSCQPVDCKKICNKMAKAEKVSKTTSVEASFASWLENLKPECKTAIEDCKAQNPNCWPCPINCCETKSTTKVVSTNATQVKGCSAKKVVATEEKNVKIAAVN